MATTRDLNDEIPFFTQTFKGQNIKRRIAFVYYDNKTKSNKEKRITNQRSNCWVHFEITCRSTKAWIRGNLNCCEPSLDLDDWWEIRNWIYFVGFRKVLKTKYPVFLVFPRSNILFPAKHVLTCRVRRERANFIWLEIASDNIGTDANILCRVCS